LLNKPCLETGSFVRDAEMTWRRDLKFAIKYIASLPIRGVMMVTSALLSYIGKSTIPKHDFAPGQMWSIKSDRPTTAKVIIGLVGNYHSYIAVHCAVIDIPLPRSGSQDRVLRQINYFPIAVSALAASVDKLLSTGISPSPDFEKGYERWRSDKEAGIFTIGVSEIIALMLEADARARA
jgi:hypothetical protein